MRVILVLILCLAVLPAAGRADDDITAARSVITGQADAFSRDDDAAAYGYAAPALKQIFPQSAIFMAMVRTRYAPIYRHKSFEFGAARMVDGRIEETVHIIDANGEAWEALYTLEHESDGSLKIIGCVLKKALAV